MESLPGEEHASLEEVMALLEAYECFAVAMVENMLHGRVLVMLICLN